MNVPTDMAEKSTRLRAEMDDDWQPDAMEDETARDIGQDLPEGPPASVRVPVVPAVAALPKIPVTDEGNRQRKQFWAVVNKAGLSSKSDKATREVISINTLTRDEWQSVISGVEYQSLVW